MDGMLWRPPSGVLAERRRRTRGRPSGYWPIPEKPGFWPNYWPTMAGAGAALAFAVYFLAVGWAEELRIGGPTYYLMAVAGLALAVAFPVHVVLRYRRMQRIIEGRDG